LSRVIQTPQRIGMPTAAQTSTAAGPMPPGLANPAMADTSPLTCKAAISVSDTNHFRATGRTMMLAISPITSSPANRYNVTS
jgi:hypothetical protein